MDWWSFLTRNGHGNKSLHIEYQTCTSNLRWCTSKSLALCSPQIMLNMLRIYILLISIWCRLSLYVLCSDMPSLFALYISGYELVHHREYTMDFRIPDHHIMVVTNDIGHRVMMIYGIYTLDDTQYVIVHACFLSVYRFVGVVRKIGECSYH